MPTEPYALCPIPYALCPVLIFLRKAIFNIYTSFKANKVRSTEIFKYLLLQLMKETTHKCKWEELALFT